MALVLTLGGAGRWSRWAASRANMPSPARSPPSARAIASCPPIAATSSTAWSLARKRAAPDPERMMRAYFRAAATANLVRAFAQGGYADLHRPIAGISTTSRNSELRGAMRPWPSASARRWNSSSACGLNAETAPQLTAVDFYFSHEALLLHYEEAMTRIDSTSGEWYDTSAHMLWIGDRTRGLERRPCRIPARGQEPDRLKCGPSLEPDELVRSSSIVLNPADEPGGSRSLRVSARTRRPSTCRGSSGASSARAAQSCGRAIRCTAIRSSRPRATRRVPSTAS